MSEPRVLTGLSLWRTIKAVAWSFVGLRANFHMFPCSLQKGHFWQALCHESHEQEADQG